MKKKILIIGFGVMGQAIAGRVSGEKKDFVVSVTDTKISQGRTTALKMGLLWESAVADNIQNYDVVFIAVKPQDVLVLAQNIKSRLAEKTLLISIAAGVSLKKLVTVFAHKKIVRLMPSLGLSVGQGIAAWKSSKFLNLSEKKFVKNILFAFTENFEVEKESEIDAITAISGSGPAYFFYLAQSLEKAAKKLGIKPNRARKLVEKTFLAAGLLQQNFSYEMMIAKIASKKGTTEAALKILDKRGMGKIIKQAVLAAYKRAGELSNKSNE